MPLMKANSGVTDEMPQYAASHHDLHCLLMNICINQMAVKIRFRGKERDYCIRNIAA